MSDCGGLILVKIACFGLFWHILAFFDPFLTVFGPFLHFFQWKFIHFSIFDNLFSKSHKYSRNIHFHITFS